MYLNHAKRALAPAPTKYTSRSSISSFLFFFVSWPKKGLSLEQMKWDGSTWQLLYLVIVKGTFLVVHLRVFSGSLERKPLYFQLFYQFVLGRLEHV